MKYELSYWERESFLKNIHAVVVGSGLVGLTAALHLKTQRPHWNVLVVERGGMPIGASTRNAGFACFGSMTELLDDLQVMSPDEVWHTVERRWKGLERLRQLTGDKTIDFYQHGGYEMFTAADTPVYEHCLEHLETFNRMAGDITGHREVYKVADERLPQFGFRGVKHLLINQAEGQIHTGKMMQTLLRMAAEKGITVLNGINIDKIHDSGNGVVLETSAGWPIHSDRALVCSNGFARQLFPEIAVIPARNQVLITHPVAGLQVEGCFHYDRGYFYFRNIDGRILLGGGRNLDPETECTDQFAPNEKIRIALLDLLHQVIAPGQQVEVDTWWTGILGLGPVKKPIIERVSNNVAVAVRMSGMGVASGSLVGQDGADLLLE